jgi:hypothetical protein
MFEEPERRPRVGFLWWVIPFVIATALFELWRGAYDGAVSQASLALLMVIQAVTEGRATGWLLVAQWSLLILFGSLLMVKVTR